MSQYKTRQYDVFMFFASPDAENIWNWQRWNQLAPLLDPFMHSPRGRTSVRMNQYQADTSLTLNQSYIRFGQLGWNEKSHQKWAHGSPQTTELSQAWEFGCASIWAPAPGICEREECPPDAYLVLKNELASGLTRKTCRFAYTLLFAVAGDVSHEGLPELLAACRELTQPVLAEKNSTTWYPSFSSGSMTDWEIHGGSFKTGPLHGQPISAHLLKGDWIKICNGV